MTAPCADTDVLGDVDFDRSPVCEVMYGRPEYPRDSWRACNRPAAWIAHIPCCDFSLLVCSACHADPAPWSCRKCNAHIPDGSVRWVRL
jgi:hypothetical protein